MAINIVVDGGGDIQANDQTKPSLLEGLSSIKKTVNLLQDRSKV
jgi:hypothetical protein